MSDKRTLYPETKTAKNSLPEKNQYFSERAMARPSRKAILMQLEWP